MVLFLSSSLICLIVFEAGLWFAGWGGVVVFSPRDDCGYLMRPGQRVFSYGVPVDINSHGLRGPEFTAYPPSDRVRIVFVGDSITYGGGRIREADLFCRVVERLATDAGLSWEVVNLSAPGWSPQNWHGYIQQQGLHQADAVVLGLPECNLDRPFATLEVHGFSTQPPWTRSVAVAGKLLDLAMRRDIYYTGDPEREVRANLECLSALQARLSSKPLLVVWVPSATPGEDARYWPPFAALVPDALDLRGILAREDLFHDGIHLNSRGHAVAGEAIYTTLRKRLTPGE